MLSEKTKRTFKFGTNAIVLTIAVIVISVLAIIACESFGSKLTLDFTTEKLYSITDTTKDLMKKLDKTDKKIEITVLLDRTKAETNAYSSGYDVSNVVKVLDIYDSFDSIDVNYIDPNKNPSVVTDVLGELLESEEGEVSTQLSTLVSDCGEGDVIVKCDDKVKIVEMSDMFATSQYTDYNLDYISGIQIETVMTAAVLHVTQENAPKVYFSTGYGENDLSKYSALTFDLEFMGYSVNEVDLSKEDVPKDAAIIFFVGPKQDLSETVTDHLEDWFLNSQGNAVFMMDVDTTGTDLPNFNYIFKLFGLKINNDEVKEASTKSLAGNTYAFKSTTLTQGAFQEIPNTEVTIENSRSISIVSDDISRRDAFILVQTTADAKSILIPSGKTEEGQKIVVASGENYEGTTEAKILLMGSSKNVVDNFDYGNGMSRILLKAVNWMYESELENEATDIKAKTYNATTVSVSEKSSKWIAAVSIIIYPALILSGGLFVWLKRRHL